MSKQFSRHKYRNGLVQGKGSVAAIAITVLMLALIALRFIAPGVLATITTPLWNTGSYLVSFVHSEAPGDSEETLLKQRDDAVAKNTELTVQNASLAAQVADLTALLGSRVEPEKGIVAAVLARPPVAPYDVLITDQGTSAGVTIGALAMGPGGTPIGTVGEADPTQSRIALFSTQGFKNEGWVGASRIPVTIIGAGAGAFKAEVPKDTGIKVGDGVYLSGRGAMPIGTVVRIETDPSSPTVDLDVRPYTNPFSTTWVTIAR